MVGLRIYALVFLPIAFSHPLDSGQARPRSLSPPIGRSTHAFSFPTSKAIITSVSPAWALELKHRAISGLDTCGYISGDPDFPVTCDLSYRCITWEASSVAGCCNTQTVATDCVIPTACVPYNAFKSCTSCAKDSLATTCRSSASPFCSENHYLYGGGLTLTQYGCGTTSSTETIFTTPGSTTPDSTTTTSSAARSAPPGRPTPSPAPGTPTESMVTDFNVGAAVGGAVGGFIVLALLTFWAWSRIRKKKQKAATSPSSGSSAAQPASMTETQNVATTAATPTVSHTGQRILVLT